MLDTSGYLSILLKHKPLYVYRIYSNRRLPRINTVRAISGGGGRGGIINGIHIHAKIWE